MRIATLLFTMLFLGSLAMPVNAQAKKLDPEVATLVQGNHEFATNLYQQLASKDGNLFFSPYSISSALAMTYAGAKGDTAREMKSTLHFPFDDKNLHPAFGKLIAQLHGENKKQRPFQFTVANRLWGQKNYGFLPDFIRTGQNYYDAGLEEVDFVNATEEARKAINQWVEKQTNDKIKNLIPPGVLTEDSRLVLTNAIYFKAAWLLPFQPKATKPAPFHLANGKTIQVPMMSANQTMRFADLGSFAVLDIPYVGYEQAMTVLLPKKKDGLAELEKKLTAENLNKWTAKLGVHTVDLKLPKFKITSQFALKETLQQMGMKQAFIPGKADFSGMATGEKLFISAVLHKAFVDVNEAGTEAAASTAVVIGATSLPPPATFHADHPFLFLIRDTRTGSVLFLGRVVNPG